MDPNNQSRGGVDGRLLRPLKRRRTGGVCKYAADSPSGSALPSEIWAMVMNYLDYPSVLSCAAASNVFLRDTMPLVTELHITRSSQLNALASRYRDVREINIFSLVSHQGEYLRVDRNTATKAVLFISCFNKLEKVFMGGRFTNGSIFGYKEYDHMMYAHSEGLVSTLINQISQAFRLGLLPESLCVLGLRCPRCDFNSPENPQPSNCQVCKLACKTWPVEHVVNFRSLGLSQLRPFIGEFGVRKPNHLGICYLTRTQIDDIVRARPGGNELLCSASPLFRMLGEGMLSEIVSDDGTQQFYVVEFHEKEIRIMNHFIEIAGLDVNKLSCEDVAKALMKSFTKNDQRQPPLPNSRYYLGITSFNHLKSKLNLPINARDWIDPVVANKHNIPQIIKALKANLGIKSLIQLDCLKLLSRMFMHRKSSHIQQAIDCGLLPQLVRSLGIYKNCRQWLSPTIDVLNSIIVHGTVAQTQALVEAGIIPKLVWLLHMNNQDLALSCLSLAKNHTHFRDVLLQEGIAENLSQKLDSSHSHVCWESVSSVMESLCTASPTPDISVAKTCLKPLYQLLQTTNQIARANALSALNALCKGSDDIVRAVIDDQHIFWYVVDSLCHESQSLQKLALGIIIPHMPRLIMSSDEMLLYGGCAALAVSCEEASDKVYLRVLELITHSSEKVQAAALRAICWCIARKKSIIIENLASKKLLPTLMSQMSSQNKNIQSSATWIMSALVDSKDKIHLTLSHGCLQSFCAVLSSSDLSTVMLGLQGIFKVMKLSDKNDRIWNMRRVRKDLSHIDLKLVELKKRRCSKNGCITSLRRHINVVQLEVRKRV